MEYGIIGVLGVLANIYATYNVFLSATSGRIKILWTLVDLSRFSAAPSARLSQLAFESDGAFPAQC